MNRRTRRVLALGVLLALAGCNRTSDSLRARFAKEYGCPEVQVSVVEGGGTVYRASGCGKSAEYVCGNFAASESDAARCEERGLPRKAPLGGDRPPFPEPADHPPPPGGPSR